MGLRHGRQRRSALPKGAFRIARLNVCRRREKPNLRAALKEPAEVAFHGRYPTAYSVVYDRATHAYTVALEGLRER